MEHLKLPPKDFKSTSSFDVEIKATVNQLRAILGNPGYADNCGRDKTNYEWERETVTGIYFTVYDWKEYRKIKDTEIISWHIGTQTFEGSLKAKEELQKALSQSNKTNI